MTGPHLCLDHTSNISRRKFLKRLGRTAGTAAGLAAFGRSGLLGAQNVVTLNMWASGTMTVEDYWQRLEKDEGIRINFSDNGNDPGPVVAKMVFGNANDIYDIGGLQGGAEKELALQNAISPWDMKQIPNWEHVWSWAKEIPYIVHDGEQYGIPTVINADSMIYLPDKVGKVDSYAAVFDPKLKGKTAMEDAWINSAIFTAIYLKENGLVPIGDPGNLSEDELGAVMEFLIKQKTDGQFRTFWNGWEQGLCGARAGYQRRVRRAQGGLRGLVERPAPAPGCGRAGPRGRRTRPRQLGARRLLRLRARQAPRLHGADRKKRRIRRSTPRRVRPRVSQELGRPC
jgi:spermidine/putrescine-binding protein